MTRKIALLFTLLLSCEAKTESAKEAPVVASATVAPSAASQSSSPSPQAALDRIDARTPVPLLPMMANHQKQNMRDHLAAVQQIVAATAKNDFATIEKAAGRIGFSEQMGQMCEHMGAGAPGFTELALKFHRDADKIGEAARKHDSQQVLSLLGQTLSQCTGCHETYKQHVVDEAEWSDAAGAPAPHHRVD
jgi:cytochrome c556